MKQKHFIGSCLKIAMISVCFSLVTPGFGGQQSSKKPDIHKIEKPEIQILPPCTARIVSVQCGPGLQAFVHVQASCGLGISSYALWWTYGGAIYEKKYVFPAIMPKSIDETVTIAHSMPDDVDRHHEIGFAVRDGRNYEAKTFATEPGGCCPSHAPGVSLAVLVPNGGEQWIAGSSQTVTWRFVQPDHMNIAPNPQLSVYLFRNGVDRGFLGRFPAHPDSFTWAVGRRADGSMAQPGSGYKIKILGSVLVDESDSTFEIVPSGGK